MESLISTKALLATIFFIVLGWFARYHAKRRRLYQLAAKFNGPTPLPLIGNLLKCRVQPTEIVEAVIKSTEVYKSPQRFWFGPNLIVHIFDPENLKILLNSPHALDKEPHMYRLIDELSGHGLGTSPVDMWKRHRKLINPIFNKKFLENFMSTFTGYSQKLVLNLEKYSGQSVFDVYSDLMNYSKDTIMDTLLGYTEKNTTDTRTFSDWVSELCIAVTVRMTNIWYFPDFIYNRSAYGKKMLKIKGHYDKYMHSIISKWTNDTLKEEKIHTHFQDEDSSKPKKLIEHLLAISDGKGKLTPEELYGEVNTILIAGFETTSTALGFTLVLLGMHPDVQEKVYQEVSQIFDSKKELDYEDLNKLKYLKAVIKESMRLFPPVPVIARYTDAEIQLTNHIIPANTSVIIGTLMLHRNPDVWENPNVFNPNRFLSDNIHKNHLYSWLPFSGGPRNCIGLQFGLMSMKIVLANLIMKYKVQTTYKSVEEVKLTLLFKLHPTNGFKISLSSRG